MVAWVPSGLNLADVPSRGPPPLEISSAGGSCGSAARGDESCAGAPTVRAALQQLLETPLSDEPGGAGDELTAGAAESHGSFSVRSATLGAEGAGRPVPIPEPPPSTFIGQEDTVLAPDEDEDVYIPMAASEAVLEARRLISNLGGEIARHLVQEGAPPCSGYSHPPSAQGPARGAGGGEEGGPG